MKHFLIAVMALILSQTAWSQANINFQVKTHDFGNIKEEVGEVNCEFSFTNKGKSNLIIYRAVASCGCTTPIFSKEPIAPGAKSTIKVSYSTTDRPGTFQKTITIYTNDPDNSSVVLIIRGSVLAVGNNPSANYPKNLQGLRLSRSSIPIMDAKIGSIKTETIEMMNATDRTLSVKFNKVPKHLRVFASNTQLKPNQTGIITINYVPSQAKDFGRREDLFYVYTSEKYKAHPDNRILVTANITEDFSGLSKQELLSAPISEYSTNRIDFGSLEKGKIKQMSIKLSNRGKSNLVIKKIAPEYDGIRVMTSQTIIPPGKTTLLKMTFNPGNFEGKVVQRVTLYTNDPKSSVKHLYLTAQIPSN